MIMDERLEFGDELAANGLSTTLTLVGDVIDLGIARDLPGSPPLYLVIQVVTAADGGSGGTGTTQFILASDAAAAIAVDGTETRHLATDVFTAAQLTAGKTFVFPLPAGGTAGGTGYERYLGLLVLPAAEEEDDMTINAFLTLEGAVWQSYADASN